MVKKLFFIFLNVALINSFSGYAWAFSNRHITIETQTEHQTLYVQVAKQPEELQTGLMHRKTLSPYAGMLFDFETPQPIAMWMKNTPLPLDMLFISEDKTINHIHRHTTPYSTEAIASMHLSQYVLELEAGKVDVLRIKIGDKILWETE